MMSIVTMAQGNYIQAALSAVAPWRSVDALSSAYPRRCEAQEIIDRCLDCPCPECLNCMSRIRRSGI